MNRFVHFSFAAFCMLWSLSARGLSEIVRTDRGETVFFSKAAGPARDIHASDKTGEVSLHLSNGSLEAKLQMQRFSLPTPLMQKHYNERYMHTDRFPYATFSGTIDAWQKPEKDGSFKVTAYGDFTVHGVTRKKKIAGTITKEGNKYRLDAEFDVRLEDHNITIPVLFFTRITESVRVTVKYELMP